jgi:hypothetical protein
LSDKEKLELIRILAASIVQSEYTSGCNALLVAAAGFIIGPFEAALYNSIAFGIAAAIRPGNLKPAQKVVQIHPLDPE